MLLLERRRRGRRRRHRCWALSGGGQLWQRRWQRWLPVKRRASRTGTPVQGGRGRCESAVGELLAGALGEGRRLEGGGGGACGGGGEADVGGCVGPAEARHLLQADHREGHTAQRRQAKGLGPQEPGLSTKHFIQRKMLSLISECSRYPETGHLTIRKSNWKKKVCCTQQEKVPFKIPSWLLNGSATF